MKFVDFAKKIKEGIDRVYLVEGDEGYFRDRVVDTLREMCVQQPSLNDVRLEGDAVKGEKLSALRDNLYALPFLSEYRMVRIYEFYPTEKEYETVLKGYVEKPCPSTVLVIVNSKKKNGVDLKRKAGITYVDCAKESEEVVAKWLFGMFRRSGLNAEQDAVQRMVRYCNNDCARMKQEIAKLVLLLGQGGTVTSSIVEEYISKDVEYKTYELTQAAARKSYAAFAEILYDLLDKGYDEHMALASLTAHFRTLYEVSAMRGTDGEIANALGVKPYAVQKNREQAARLGREKVKEYYLRLYELSCGAKSGIYTKENALFAAIAKIFFS